MQDEVRELQQRAVERLVEMVKRQDEVTLKAPTGSGKTHMMADFMDRMLAQDGNVVFIVSSLSKAGLARQNFEAFEGYIADGKFPRLDPYLISSEEGTEGSVFIPTGHNVYVLPRDLYKDKSKLKQDAALLKFLLSIRVETSFRRICLIKDECHVATSNLDELRGTFFDKVINFSATPNLRRNQVPDVEIREADAVAAHLIKRVEYGSDTDTLDDALEKFVDVKRAYLDHGISVNPCLIIQISNKDKADEEVARIKNTLAQRFPSLKWMLILDNSEKKSETNDIIGLKRQPLSRWKYFARQDSSTIDVIIFKMVITEGWDIRRACMLFQVRDSKSRQLDEQVIGRVRRNPRLLDFERLTPGAQELVSTAWVWGIRPKDESKGIQLTLLFGSEADNEVQREVRIQTTRLRPFETRQAIDIDALPLKEQDTLAPKSIFDLWRELQKAPAEVQDRYRDYVDSYGKFFRFTGNIAQIKKAVNDYCCDYSKNMEVTRGQDNLICEVSFPYRSSFTRTDHDRDIDNWVWRQEKDDDEFSFDSQAEEEWAKKLLKLRSDGVIKRITVENEEVLLMGKNFLENSEIKYEYYNCGRHFSYPDFVMKDTRDRIHIFEVKSLNISGSLNMDSEEYRAKANVLKAFYAEVSKKTPHFYYLPVKSGGEWHVWRMAGGNTEYLSFGDFVAWLKG